MAQAPHLRVVEKKDEGRSWAERLDARPPPAPRRKSRLGRWLLLLVLVVVAFAGIQLADWGLTTLQERLTQDEQAVAWFALLEALLVYLVIQVYLVALESGGWRRFWYGAQFVFWAMAVGILFDHQLRVPLLAFLNTYFGVAL